MNENNHKFISLSLGMLLVNLILILVICLIREDLSIMAYFHYMFYAGVINVILGFLVKLGNRETKASNEMLNYFFTHRKTSDELFNENIKAANKATYFMLIFEIIGIILVITSNIISKII